MEITLMRTCGACPEQYNAVDEAGRVVGYLRLRHGYFSVRYPHADGALIYDAYPEGDGMFEFDEREHYLTQAITAIRNALSPIDGDGDDE